MVKSKNQVIMKKLNISFFLPLIVFIAAGLSLSSCKDTLDMPIEEAIKFNPKDDPFLEVCKHASEVLNTITTDYYDKCSSIAELSEYLDEIKSLEYVEDAYCTNISMFVKIKDFRTVSYSFFPEMEAISGEGITRMIKEIETRAMSEDSNAHPLLGLKTGVIINQWYHDEDRKIVVDFSDRIRQLLDLIGIHTIPQDAPLVRFFSEDIYDFDFVLLVTHGSYDPNKQLHWILTSEIPTSLNYDDLYKTYKNYPEDQASLGFVEEIRHGEKMKMSYISISERFITACEKTFNNNGNAIVFNISCQSMMGGDKETFIDLNLRDDSLAQAFITQGAGLYFGYDETSGLGYAGLLNFVERLFSGMSLDRAYKSLPKLILHDPESNDLIIEGKNFVKDVIADLYHYPKTSPLLDMCLTNPALNNNEKTYDKFPIKLKADFNIMRIQNLISGTEKDKYELEDDLIVNDFKYGFEISKSSDFSEKKSGAVSFNEMKRGIADGMDYGIASFELPLSEGSVEFETTYYYRAYFFDGEEYYYSDIDSFTTPKEGSGNTEDPKDTGNTGNNAQTQDVPGTDL